AVGASPLSREVRHVLEELLLAQDPAGDVAARRPVEHAEWGLDAPRVELPRRPDQTHQDLLVDLVFHVHGTPPMGWSRWSSARGFAAWGSGSQCPLREKLGTVGPAPAPARLPPRPVASPRVVAAPPAL